MTDSSVSPRRTGPRRALAVASVAIVVAAAVLIYFNFFQTYHLVVVDPGKVYRNGHRSLREFKNSMRQAHAKTIVAVIDDEEYIQPEFVEERDYCKANGLEYIWIKVKAGAFPRPEQVKQFLAIATDPAKQPVFYHDDEGIRRAGMMMAAYQMSVLGYDKAKALAAIHPFGHGDRTINDVRRFIEVYNPVNGLPYDLNAGAASATRPTTDATTQPPRE